ncbi:hypothetical protein PQX77_022020 [Marasmius sp. AFHP31]|nr:hypothetical protein PQX77_022020 [Marasmius sp. AFHP31]
MPKKHAFLARKQNTRVASLTIHTVKEKKLFPELMRNDSSFCDSRWPEAARTWNTKADGAVIFYKIVEHLQAYYQVWKANTNSKHTLMATANARKAIDTVIHHDRRLIPAPSVPNITTPEHILPTAGERVIDGEPVPSSYVIPREPPKSTFTKLSVKKRNRSPDPPDDVDKQVQKRKRSRRTCPRCGKGEECKGNLGRDKCTHPCRDCGRGKDECAGRDSRKPNKVRCTVN